MTPASDHAPSSRSATRPVQRGVDALRDRHVLVLTSRFPPETGPGATRAAATVRHLSALGWRVTVVTRGMPARRLTYCAGGRVPDRGIRVYRVPNSSDDRRTAAAEPRGLSSIAARLRRGVEWRLQRGLEAISLPDAGIRRLPRVLRLLSRIHRRRRIDLIHSSAMPFSDHLIALAASVRLRVPWTAEFRDPWVEYAHAPQWRGSWTQALVLLMEACVVRRAQRVVSVSAEMTRRFQERYPRIPAAKFITVLNGFEPGDFAEAASTTTESAPSQQRPPPALPTGEMVLLHAGSLYGGRSPQALLEALALLARRDAAAARVTRLVFAGRTGAHQSMIEAAARSLPVSLLGELPHREVAALMRQAAANVLLLAGGPGTEGDLSSKVFEYLGSRRPILAITPTGGAAARFLARHEQVWQADSDDVESIAAALRHMARAWREGRLHERHSATRLIALTREFQTGLLDRAMRRALSAGKRTRLVRARRAMAASTQGGAA